MSDPEVLHAEGDEIVELPALNLLSLDSGGITGLSSLLIIKEIMTRLQEKKQRTDIPKPCEHFDMIAGTGTGAISAIMLGRLRMSVDDAITSYVQLMKVVFSQRKYTIKRESGAFKSSIMKKELKEIVRQAVGDGDAKLMEKTQENEKIQCKVIVYAMSSYNLTRTIPMAFRSYSSTTSTTSCAIWEALRATTTHPEIFKGIEIEIEGTGVRDVFTYGGMGCANPTPRLLEEARSLYPGRAVASIISIGTGHSSIIQIATWRTRSIWTRGSMMERVLQAAQEMAEGSERVAEEMARRFADIGPGYYRLNLQQGTQGIDASEWERLGEVAAHTRAYLDQAETKLKLNRLAETISQRTVVLDTAQIDGRAMRVPESTRDGIRNCPPSSARFTGRDKYTKKVQIYFTGNSHGRCTFVLYGLGGAGKTQIALKCAEELRERFAHVIFVDASSEGAIQTSFATIALKNNLGKKYEDMQKWISRHGRSCLLIFDNADDPKMNLQIYFPQCADYNVLVTTRRSEFAALTGDVDAACDVSGLEQKEAAELLLKTVRLRPDQMNEVERTAMYELLESFGFLALAVVQAGAYIWKMQLSVSQYWDKYSTRRQKLPDGGVGLGMDGYRLTVYTTWELNLNQLSPHARELLFLVAFLHHDGILEEIFQRAALNLHDYEPNMPSTPRQLAVQRQVQQFLSHLTNDRKWDDAFADYIGELMSFSLVTYNKATQAYSIHPLVQDWARIAAYRQESSLQNTALLLALSIDRGKNGLDYAYKRRILPHVNLIIEWDFSHGVNTADRFAEVYRATGQYQNEATLWEQTILIRTQQLGEYHLGTLAARTSLARVYQKQHKLVEAKTLLETTLATQRYMAGEDHPDTLKTMHYLAWTLGLQSQFPEAESLLTTVITSRKQILGEDHPDTLESMDDLASTYDEQGLWRDGEVLRRAVMATRKKVLGKDHVDTVEGMGNLALTYREQSRFSEAVTLYQAVVASRQRLLGEDHPETISSTYGLAYTYQLKGRLAEAESLYVIVTAASKRVLGEDDPQTLLSMTKLADIYYFQGRLIETEALETAILASRRRILGPTHPDTIKIMQNLELTYSGLGKDAERDALRKELALIPGATS